MKFPTLFKKTSTGAQQQWEIWTEGRTIRTRWGQSGGAMQEGAEVINEGKNIGKKNETTAERQAELEAQSKWELKKKKHLYVESAESAMAGEVDDLVEGGISPMLAHRYDQHGHKISWPARAQPKLDGHRCIGMVKQGVATLWSRTRKLITGVPHINQALEELIEGDALFDGELYNHAYRDNFEDLTSFIRQQEPKEGHEVVEYHVYDLPWIDGGFSDRFATLKEFFDAAVTPDKPLKLVETLPVNDEEGLMEVFETFLKQGYEGAMVRNTKGAYLNKRSYDLLKVKTMADSDYRVVGVNEGKGKMSGMALFLCETESGSKFSVKMMGALEGLRQYWKNPELAVGRLLTVRYQNLTAEGLPRFPVGVRFREDL